MSIVAGDPLTQLSFSIYESKGVFALLLGSGLSRAAQIPTGWEITLDLVRRVARAQGIEDKLDWAAWYREKVGAEPDYCVLLEELASSPDERRAILHSYIEPTEDDRREGRKLPTAAHRAIAALVQGGYIRVIITTNFDRLMENALRERGIEPTVVASVDALAGAEPLTHSGCYIFKIHGDYKDSRILNIETELGSYPAAYDALLDRILDEHGLVVCGWSGEWDRALRAAFLRAPNRRYSVFWAARGTPGSGASELIAHRRARLIPTTDADSFFAALQQRVETLEQTHRQNPLGVELLVGSAKRFLAKPEHRIQLDELFTQEAERVIEQLDSADFPPHGPWNQDAFRARVKRYEALSEALASMAGVLGRWGDDNEFPLCLDLIRSLHAQAEKVGSGLIVYLGIRSYPAVLVFTAYGLGLVRAERWSTLHRLFDAHIDREHKEPRRVIETLFLRAWKGTDQDAWKQIEGLEQHKTAFSDHLADLFREWGKRFVGLVPDFELLYERFEMLGALAHFEQNDKTHVTASLAGDAHQGGVWMPVGRTGWHRHTAEWLVAELRTEPMKEQLVHAGFAKRDKEIVDLFIQNFSRFARRMS